jgi:hypothetical protein
MQVAVEYPLESAVIIPSLFGAVVQMTNEISCMSIDNEITMRNDHSLKFSAQALELYVHKTSGTYTD